MEERVIDCTEIRSREDLHEVFARELHFPAWYGRNLDALHDCLTELTGTVRLLDWDVAEHNLGKYGLAAKKAIAAAAFENEKLDLIL